MPSQQSQSAPQESPQSAQLDTKILPDEMGLEEVMRVMDVASTLRREQELVEREFNLDKTKEMLREKLRRTAEMTGETLTPEQIEAAVNWYYDNLHEFEEPPRSFKWYLAQLYVARGWIMRILIPFAIAAGAIWGLWFAPFAPFSDVNRQQDILNAAQQSIGKSAKSIKAVSQSDDVNKMLDKLLAESKTHHENGDLKKIETVRAKLADIDQRINQEYTITVVGGEDQRSGIDRYQPNGEFSGYYLIVQARDPKGRVLKQRIKNIETDKYHTVDTWGEKVPKDVFDRLVADKKEDGILNETTFAKKKRGELDVKMIIPGAYNLPVERSGQITQW